MPHGGGFCARCSMNILFASAEVAPFAKAGGLGDVAGALPGALCCLGHDARVVMPRYRTMRVDPNTIEQVVASFNVYYDNPLGRGRLLLTRLPDKTPVYLLDFPCFNREPLSHTHSGMYGYDDDILRFIIFARGVMALAQHLRAVEGWNPDIIHANDWHTGLVPNYLQFNDAIGLPDTASVFTIHNLAYQGKADMGYALHCAELSDQPEEAHHLPADTFNIMARGIIYADAVSTVSAEYAHEITTPEYGEGLHRILAHRSHHGDLYGILNGIDTKLFNPATDPQLQSDGYQPYDMSDLSGKVACKMALQRECNLEVNRKRPLLAMVTRLVEQKGIDSLLATLPAMLRLVEDAQIVILGSDEDKRYQAALRYIESRYNDHFHLSIGFFPKLAQHIYAGCDMIIVPSLFEPCGLIQMIAMRYGSVPIVRKTGGLADTVREGANGFVFGEPIKHDWITSVGGLSDASPDVQEFVYRTYNIDHLLATMLRALHVYRTQPQTWNNIQRNGMKEDHSWERAALPYLSIYKQARAKRGLAERN